VPLLYGNLKKFLNEYLNAHFRKNLREHLRDYFRKHLKSKRVRLAVSAAGFIIITFFGGLELTAQPAVCSMCHTMNPEYYTWQRSSHSGIGCAGCHVSPGPAGLLKSCQSRARNLYLTFTGAYVSPIVKLSPIPDRACERCHKSASEDREGRILAAHDVHKTMGVSCIKCHSGIAHGRIAERGITFPSDYQKWDSVLAESMMNDKQNTTPDMDACFRCHRLRKGPLECQACHRSVKPETHLKEGFKDGGHGKTAAANLTYCDKCHQYMSTQKTMETGREQKYLEYLSQGETSRQSNMVIPYSRINTFCRDCHAKRPPSHSKNTYIKTHSIRAEEDQNGCMTCHDNQYLPGAAGEQAGQGTAVTDVFCAKCHPSSHRYSLQWRNGYHPTDLPAKPRITTSCYTCHSEKICGRCHGSLT